MSASPGIGASWRGPAPEAGMPILLTRIAGLGYRAAMLVRARLVGLVATLALALAVGASPSTAAASCAPYCDKVTKKITNHLNGTGHGAWLATVLDDGGYNGRRHAEITRIPSGHGKRYVGVIHVPAGKAKKAHRALMDFLVRPA